MDNNNPAEMSNEDLENDMQNKNEETKGNQENLNKSTAAEGTLKEIDEDEAARTSIHTTFKADEEQDLDDLVHTQAAETVDAMDGSIPDPEALDAWETNDDDINKISS